MLRLGLGQGGEENFDVHSCLSPQAVFLMWR